MVLNNKTRFVLLAMVAITSLFMSNVQAYAANDQQGNDLKNVPTLAVYIHVINDDGGTMKASDFAVTVTAKDPSPSIFSGSETGTTVTMKNSEYKLTELEVKGYKVSYSPGCSGRINNNEAKTCVVTNDDIAPHLKVIKHVINDNGGIAKASDFAMYVYGSNPTPSSFPGSENGTDVKIGQGYYNVDEYWNPDYLPSYSPECNGQINLGETKTCTITNDDKPKAQLIVKKHVINDNGGMAVSSDFIMFVYGDNPSQSTFPGSEEGTTVTLNEGYYSVSENYRSDYSQSNSPDCSGFIKGGEIKTCTITNDDLPPAHLVIIKHVINDNGGAANASDFTMFVYGNNPSPSSFPGSETGTDVKIGGGFYNVDESFNPQYSRFFSGDCYGYIYSGETRTCTITNDDLPPTYTYSGKV